jgi:hypothetical protein
MTSTAIIKDSRFTEVAEVRPDAKKRVGLGRLIKLKARLYRVYQNTLGQIILDPMETIPAHETWLFKNKTAHASVMTGLDEARRGKLLDSPEDFSKFTDNE